MNLISSQVAGVELNRGNLESSDQIGIVRFSFLFSFLLPFRMIQHRSHDTYDTAALRERVERLAVTALPLCAVPRTSDFVTRAVCVRRQDGGLDATKALQLPCYSAADSGVQLFVGGVEDNFVASLLFSSVLTAVEPNPWFCR